VLFNEPKLLKLSFQTTATPSATVSVLFNEPKLLKCPAHNVNDNASVVFQCSSTSRNC